MYDEGNGLYLFFLSDAMADCGFDVSYAYDRYLIAPEALKKLKTDHVKTEQIKPFFDLPLFRQYEALREISDGFEISDFDEWAESCEKKLCRLLPSGG